MVFDPFTKEKLKFMKGKADYDVNFSLMIKSIPNKLLANFFDEINKSLQFDGIKLWPLFTSITYSLILRSLIILSKIIQMLFFFFFSFF